MVCLFYVNISVELNFSSTNRMNFVRMKMRFEFHDPKWIISTLIDETRIYVFTDCSFIRNEPGENR